ncbi:steroidogenic acute regulatory protein [Lampris incognitus]|uniref:steroidogenic acute regulatory protein n=1 Tax=Lampris incognitus TaxID=2546036 RepID=UPI0024B5B794|nr:steroidogenic acute regulatory protein [Lampris incognitus]
MLPAVVKLCCGISYPHLRSMAGLRHTAVALLGQEMAHLQQCGQVQQQDWIRHSGPHAGPTFKGPKREDARAVSLKEEELLYVQQGREAMRKALGILGDKDGWKTEIGEENGDVVYSKVVAGASKVFRLEAVLEASVEELYDILFVRVEEMHQWNPSIQHIKVLKHIGPETIVTHEVSAETAGNLIGQRDFLSVRHSCKHKSCIYLVGAATQLEAFPPQKGFVRAKDGPTCLIIEAQEEDCSRSRFTWLLNMDVKGWVPKSIVNQALPRAQLDFTRYLRRHLRAGATRG